MDRKRFKDGNKSTIGYILGPDQKRHRVQSILVRDKSGNWDIQPEDSFVMHLPESIGLPRLGPVSELRHILEDLSTTIKRIKRCPARSKW